MPVDKFPLNLQPDEQKEHRHQRVIDPVVQGERADLGVIEARIAICERAVGENQRQRSRSHQQDASRRLTGQKFAKCRTRAGEDGGHLVSLAQGRGWGKEKRTLRMARNFLTHYAMIHSRITAKSQTTIPRAVREALGIGPGDDIAYEISNGAVVLKRVAKTPRDMFLSNFSTFTEWADELDRAYDRV